SRPEGLWVFGYCTSIYPKLVISAGQRVLSPCPKGIFGTTPLCSRQDAGIDQPLRPMRHRQRQPVVPCVPARCVRIEVLHPTFSDQRLQPEAHKLPSHAIGVLTLTPVLGHVFHECP